MPANRIVPLIIAVALFMENMDSTQSLPPDALPSPEVSGQPLSGIVETDWAPYTFTMNWMFTRKDTPVSFERDEPFCMIFPMPRALIEEVKPEIRVLADDKELQSAYVAFADSRNQFNNGLRVTESKARDKGWQKDYFLGRTDFVRAPTDHRTKLKLKSFRAAK